MGERDAWFQEKVRTLPAGEMRDEHQIRELIGPEHLVYRVTNEEPSSGGRWWCTMLPGMIPGGRMTDYERAKHAWSQRRNVYFIVNNGRHWTLLVLYRRKDMTYGAVSTNSLGDAQIPSREILSAIESRFNQTGEKCIVFAL
jgi:hypothetical protein